MLQLALGFQERVNHAQGTWWLATEKTTGFSSFSVFKERGRRFPRRVKDAVEESGRVHVDTC